MKKYLSFFSVLLMSLTLVSGLGAPVQAADMSFSVHANLPNNQQNTKATYFDLKMAKEQAQTITITLENTSNQSETIAVSVNNATTNQNGVIDYTKHGAEKDPSLKVGIEDIVQNPKQDVVLAPKEKKNVAIKMKMPKKSLKGQILGGIHLTKKGQSEQKKNQNVMIQNQYSYVIGLLLREDEAFVKPNLNLRSAQPDLMNYRQVVTATLQNDQPTIIHNLNIKASISKGRKKKEYKTAQQQDMSMAPNSSFNFPVPLDGQAIEPGRYTMNIDATAEKGKYHWNLSKDFVVKKDKAKQINQEAIHDKKPFPLWGYFLIGIGVLFLIVILYLIYLLRKAHKKNS